ncbi:MAG: peptidylprolyl isomerase [Mariprofundaceae bacterium]
MKKKVTWLSILLLLALNACEPDTKLHESSKNSSPIIAQTSTDTFHESDLEAEIRSLPESLQHLKNDPAVRTQVLKRMIRRSVLSQHAQDLGLDMDPIVRNRIQYARNSLLIQSLQNWQSSRLTAPKEEEITLYYKQHKTDFTIPEHIHARHILVRTEKLAKRLRNKLLSNKYNKFETFAAEHSIDDSNKSRGGNLNWFPRGVMVKTFEKAAFSLAKVGDISAPIKTEFGWHIIELLGKRPIKHQSFESAHDEIVSLLQQQTMDAWIDQLISKANVSIIKPKYQAPKKP